MKKLLSEILIIQKFEKIVEICYLIAFFVLPFSKAIFEISIALASLFWIISKCQKASWFQTHGILLTISLLFLASSSVSAFGSGYLSLSVRGIIRLIKHIFIMLMVADLFRDPIKLRRLMLVGLTSYIFVLVDSVAQWITGRDVILGWSPQPQLTNEQIRLTGPYQSYGLLGTHIIAILPIIMSVVLRYQRNQKGRWKAIGSFLLLLISLVILYMTHSRGAWIAALGSGVVFAILVRNKWILTALIGLTLMAPFVLPRHTLFHLDIYNQEQSIVERNLLWSRAIEVIKARPLFGCGINTYVKNYQKFVPKKEWQIPTQNEAGYEYSKFGEKESWRIPGHPSHIPGHYVHNGYLQLAAETGVVSLFLFLVILGLSLRAGHLALLNATERTKFIITGFMSGTIALLLQAAVDTTLHNLQSAAFIWLYLGLLIALKKPSETNLILTITPVP